MEQVLSRGAASEAVGGQGWRYVLGTLRASVAVRSLAGAAEVAARAVAACGDDADGHLRLDLRPGRVTLTMHSRAHPAATSRDAELANLISAAGVTTEPHHVQVLEIAIDALDIAAIRPFWKAVLAYEVVWFQQMTEPRAQRNRIHFDISVPHDEAPARIAAALAAGGHLVSDSRAPAFWVLADAEGNEACVTTWQGRD
jgi:4a-hydroxytetrahydrobiopterin dehydratase